MFIGSDKVFPLLLQNKTIKVDDDFDISDEEDHVASGPSSPKVRKITNLMKLSTFQQDILKNQLDIKRKWKLLTKHFKEVTRYTCNDNSGQ